eukprot:CAMPEP_0198203204 /NCGR_PEP_ID=MMETSP1445-20131203/6460_1 /TAXON_ID=36898 /ORGANISM="Pyramimonas sp., Strain CCMP2087" /LENGTH=207 /DNA_ID=CAMNT_0043874483 /DNA_START=112 /DNA_END=735 /DNA_ORIENTATION=-
MSHIGSEKQQLFKLRDFDGHGDCLNCPFVCGARPFTEGALRLALPERTFEREYCSLQRMIREWHEMQQQDNDGVRAGTDRIRTHRDYILEFILTLKCPQPQCRTAFIDFSGCASIDCFLCNACFCAFCLELQGHTHNAAFGHALRCDFNPNQGDGFPSQEMFEAVHAERKTLAVIDYIYSRVEPEEREEIRQWCLDMSGQQWLSDLT